MLPYSAIKITAKAAALYSVLNPETSSLSPSAKSKGVRLVSASLEINQTPSIVGTTNKILKKSLLLEKKSRGSVRVDRRIAKKTKANLIS
jgi:hypothetical protein